MAESPSLTIHRDMVSRAVRALRALRDCTIIRAPASHSGFSTLVRWHMAERRFINNSEKCDFVITSEGRDYYEALQAH